MNIQGAGCKADIAVAFDKGDRRIQQVHAGGGIVRTQRADDLLCDALHRLAAGQFRYDLRLPCVSVGIDAPHRRLSGPHLPRSPPKFRGALASAQQRYLAPFYTVPGCASDAERPLF